MGIKIFFSKSTETNEQHINEKLQTRYYKSTKNKIMKEVVDMINGLQGFDVRSISEDHGEVIVNVKKGKRAFMVITIIMVRPFRTAIDLSVSTDTILFSDFGFSEKIIFELYKMLDSRLQFVGTGLGDKLTQQ